MTSAGIIRLVRMSVTISFASVCLYVVSSCWQEGDATGGGHVAGLPCNTNIGQQQQLHHPSGRRPLTFQPPGQHCTHFRLFNSGQHSPIIQGWIWSHDARPQDLGTPIRASPQTHRKHDRRYANFSVRVSDRGLPCHLHKYEWGCRNRRHACVARPW